MIRHYLLISWRNIIRNKFYSIILVLGLSIGIASSMLLGTYTWNQITYDNFHEKKDRIFLVGVREKDGENENEGGWTTPPTGPALKEFFPEVEESVRICLWLEDVLVSRDDKKLPENIIGADSSIFKVFTLPLVSGDPASALKEPNSIVITEKIARKYFGDENPLGRTLHFEHFFHECVITGVMKDLPANSHLTMDILLSLSSFEKINFDFNHWLNHTFSTYVLLREKTKREVVEERLPEFVRKNLNPYLLERYQKSYDETYQPGHEYTLFLMPLKDVHLSTMLFDNREGKRTLTYALGAIGVIILIMVCINYTNLATVLTFSRAKEVGIRKATGGRSAYLFKQFLVQSILMVFLGLFISLGLVEVLVPMFRSLTQQDIVIDYTDPAVILGLVAFGTILGVLSGIYPAATFANFNTIRALKGNTVLKGNPWFRNSLVIFQFTVCIVMMVSTVVVYKQLRFMDSKSLGFNKDQVLVVKRAYALKENKAAFKNELLKNSGVLSASYTETTPSRGFDGHGQHFAGTPADKVETIFPLIADEDILQTLDIPLVAGSGFQDQKTKKEKAILNESAVRLLGLDNPLEQTIDRGTLGEKDVDIIGIVKDFHFKSFHFNIEPLVIYYFDVGADPPQQANFLLVKLTTGNIPVTLQHVQKVWSKFAPSYPFEYSFLDQDFARLFERENTMTKVYTTFSVISVCIACLGLLGLTSFFVSKRTKEIGIRKIVGASFVQIAGILSRDFFKWIFTSIVLGSAVSWYLMQQWLQGFAYKTEISWYLFLIAAVAVMLLATLTVSLHIFKAAKRNPVETLRYE
ncbi:MAG TPA: ABC transporter permease [Chryseolinea sp.]